MIPETTVQKIKDTAKIEDFTPSTNKGYGQNKLYSKCPACGYINDKKKQGLTIDPKENRAKCFKCSQGYSNPIDYVMKTENKDYPEALKHIASRYNIFIEEEAPKPVKTKDSVSTPKGEKNGAAVKEEKPAKQKRTKKPHKVKPYCDRQLEESGLTYDDIRLDIEEDGVDKQVSPFIQGTRDQYGRIVEHRGDDVLIRYYDLDGKPVMYKPEKGTTMLHLIRVRWQNPAAHLDQFGNPIKYQSPKGSGSHVYIPEAIRRMYKQARKIKRLYIQEGEKKAEKACKHGMMSLGIMGINNLGHKNRLPDEVQRIIQVCEVEEVIFLLDSDWRNLSKNLKNGQPVDSRPMQFFVAVRNYKDYLRTLANLGHPVEIYFGYIQYNDEKEKGVDDLLTGSLKGKEDELKKDFDYAVNEKSGTGEYIQVNKITMLPDSKIVDFWMLNDADKFAAYHKKVLKNLKEFKIKGYLRRFNDQGKLEMAQQLLRDEEFWDEDVKESRSGDLKKTLKFNYVNAMVFLQNRGFWRYVMRSSEKILIKIEGRVLRVIDHTDVKDFTKEFCREIKRKDVLNMLMQGGPQYLGPEKLSNLDLMFPTIERATPEKQHLFFKDKIWEITAEGIKEINYGQFPEFVWSEKVINHKVKALPSMLDVTVMNDEIREQVGEEFQGIENGEFFLDYSKESEKSHFFQFLKNASNFQWKRQKGIEKGEITLEEKFINARHLLNKLSLIGYLLHDYKDDNELKAAIAMDGKLSEVGASNGRSGKSLIGVAISKIIPQAIIDGKNKKLDDDNFRYHEVTEKTKSIFFDDVRANFDFESLFQVITGGMTVNQKSGLRFTLSKDETPKILVTTNHAINGAGSSFSDRQAFMVFSDFYNDHHKPVHDFGVPFFSEWDFDQWNLFFNLMATCLVMYFRSRQNGWSGTKRLGIVPPPMEDVEKRKLRQTMGENYLTWAEAFFDWNSKTMSGNLNQQLERKKDLYDVFLEDSPLDRKYTPPAKFREKIVAYCHYKGYDLNPTKRNAQGLDIIEFKRLRPNVSFIGDMHKTGGKEYFTIANKDFNEGM